MSKVLRCNQVQVETEKGEGLVIYTCAGDGGGRSGQ